MHELAVTESILEISTKHALDINAKRVTDINLVLGRLSSIVDDSVQFYWDLISEGTVCERAILHFKRLPAKMLCLDCGNEYTFDNDLIPCPVCNSFHVKVLSGEEFFIESIEIEK